jgi:hypothetical protein
MSRYLADRIERLDNVEVLTGHELRELRGKGRLEAVVAEGRETGPRRPLTFRAGARGRVRPDTGQAVGLELLGDRPRRC